MAPGRTFTEAVASGDDRELPEGPWRDLAGSADARSGLPLIDFLMGHAFGAGGEVEIRSEDLASLVEEIEALRSARDLAPEGLEALADLQSMAESAIGSGLSLFGYSDTVAHETPVWRERADFLLAAWIGDYVGDRRTRWQWEQLWARRVGDDRFELCCIPFFVYDLALGDEIEAGVRENRAHVFQRVTRPSGRATFRAWFNDPEARAPVSQEIGRIGCLMEWRSATSNLLAIDAPTAETAHAVSKTLSERERAGLLNYETGRTR